MIVLVFTDSGWRLTFFLSDSVSYNGLMFHTSVPTCIDCSYYQSPTLAFHCQLSIALITLSNCYTHTPKLHSTSYLDLLYGVNKLQSVQTDIYLSNGIFQLPWLVALHLQYKHYGSNCDFPNLFPFLLLFFLLCQC